MTPPAIICALLFPLFEVAPSPTEDPAYVEANRKQEWAGNALNEKRYDEATRLYIEALSELEKLPDSAWRDPNVKLVQGSSINGIYKAHSKKCKSLQSQLCSPLGLLYLFMVVENSPMVKGVYSDKDIKATADAATKLAELDVKSASSVELNVRATGNELEEPISDPSNETPGTSMLGSDTGKKSVSTDGRELIDRFLFALDFGQGWGNYWANTTRKKLDHNGLSLGIRFGYRFRSLGAQKRNQLGAGFHVMYTRASLNEVLKQTYPNTGVRIMALVLYTRFSFSLLKSKPRLLHLATTASLGFSNHTSLYDESFAIEENAQDPGFLSRRMFRGGLGLHVCILNESFCLGSVVYGEANSDKGLASFTVGGSTDLLRIAELWR